MTWLNDRRRAELNAQHAALVARALLTNPRLAQSPRSAGGDEKRLRGIPAIGRGVAGAIPGTRPTDCIR